MTAQEINNLIKSMPSSEVGEISDGYHTFLDLYNHRIHLFIALASMAQEHLDKFVWRSRKHSDGSYTDGWFIAGIEHLPGKQITYHLPDSFWVNTESFETLDTAPVWDNHTSDDVIQRISMQFI